MQGLAAIDRALGFIVNETHSRGKILNSGQSRSDSHFNRTSLAALLRMEYGQAKAVCLSPKGLCPAVPSVASSSSR